MMITLMLFLLPMPSYFAPLANSVMQNINKTNNNYNNDIID